MVTLTPYGGARHQEAVVLIQHFWLAHNQYQQTEAEAQADLSAWTQEGHRFYFIETEEGPVGFLHLGSRGGACNWLEDIFVEPAHQRQGIGTKAIALAEEMVRQYAVSMYIEAAARNEQAIALYHRLGFRCLNTISVRKDFPGYEYNVRREERIYDRRFEIREDRA